MKTAMKNHSAGNNGLAWKRASARWLLAVMLCSGVVAGVAGCDHDDGPLEKAGKKMDETTTDVGNAVEDKCEDAKAAVGAKDTRC